MNQAPHGLDDLSALERRDALKPAERRRFEMLLSASPVSRWLHRLGQQYDRMDTERDSDAALLEQVAERALSSQLSPRVRPRRGMLVASVVLLGGLVATGAAAALFPGWVRPLAAPAGVLTSAVATSHRHDGQNQGRVSVKRVRETSDVIVPAGVATERTEREPATSASELFSRANAMRAAGQTKEALAVYRQLDTSFPSSAEGMLSNVMVGRLLLNSGQAGAAAEAFGRYLAKSPGGRLAEEALQGRAFALRALGRKAEERAVWATLLERFPNSAYAESARARLLEIR